VRLVKERMDTREIVEAAESVIVALERGQSLSNGHSRWTWR
jgi:hypothetical protein